MYKCISNEYSLPIDNNDYSIFVKGNLIKIIRYLVEALV